MSQNTNGRLIKLEKLFTPKIKLEVIRRDGWARLKFGGWTSKPIPEDLYDAI